MYFCLDCFVVNVILSTGIWRIKFNMKEVTLKPSLIFNWAMLLGGFSGQYYTVGSNGKFKQ